MTNMLDSFVAHGLGVQFDDLPPEAFNAVKTFLLDSLGVGIAGSALPLTQTIRDSGDLWSGSGSAWVWGRDPYQTAQANAAFVNAFQIHGQEYDCVHEAAVVHPMATILSATMSEVDQGRLTINGQDLAVALAVAVDLAAGIGVAVTSPIQFFRPANAGLFGATLGLSRLRRFTEEQTRDALGYALAFNSGTMQAHIEGKPALAVQIANAARAAVMACDLAAAGMPGPQDSLEGKYGYFALFEKSYDVAPVIASIGEVWRISEVSHKPFPTGRAAQGGIVLMQKLRDQGVEPDAVERIVLTAPPIIHQLVSRPIKEDMEVSYARLCFQYSGAVALREGSVGPQHFFEAALKDAEVFDLGCRIEVVKDGSTDASAFTPQLATALLKDGRTVTARIETLYGSPQDPMSREAHLDKFRACIALGFGVEKPAVSNALIAHLDALEALEDARILSRLAAGQEA